jgi:hypothetical protein
MKVLDDQGSPSIVTCGRDESCAYLGGAAGEQVPLSVLNAVLTTWLPDNNVLANRF